MSTGEGPEDKKTRLSFAVILFALLGAAAYLNHGRMRLWCCANSDAWKFAVLTVIGIAIAVFASACVRRASRSDSQ